MPKDTSIKKVLVLGSGPIVIGQAAEFDYAGTQACKALKNENIEVVLINSNPATIMTDAQTADRVYIEPLNIEVIKNIIKIEKPDGILATIGGQVGLNLACELNECGFLAENNVRVLGTGVETIKKAEDRQLFKQAMLDIGQPVIESVVVSEVAAAAEFAKKTGYPLIVRPAYTLGGTGGGFASNEAELREITKGGLRASRVHQCLIERSVAGWKEIEFEALRDGAGNTVTVCSMENLDPVGVHTGDSIVVAPVQTLADKEFQMLRSAARAIVSALGIVGSCNVQFALDPDSMRYYLIEVNPRVSRSSALASKATGYPIARVATLIALGYNLDEIAGVVTGGKTSAAFEPTIDYIVCKFPRWPFDKFFQADRTLGTRMKATGEVMSISGNFEAALLKALRSLELGFFSTEYKPYMALSTAEIRSRLHIQDDLRLFCVAEALRRGISVAEIYQSTKIDEWFLCKIKHIVDSEEQIKKQKLSALSAEFLRRVKKMGFSDRAIAAWCEVTEDEIRRWRKMLGVVPTYKQVDTCAAEFDAVSPYFYSTYEEQTEVMPDGKAIVVLGSGPIRIGQGIEFDYCSVHCVRELRAQGYSAVIINNNPETVSTDFDISDRLYFEPLTKEDVLNVLDVENPLGVVVQFGGQTAIKLAKDVCESGRRIIGTDLADIDAAEDREVFDRLLTKFNIRRPEGKTVLTELEAQAAAAALGFPVLVRPSYVLGGQGMEIAHNERQLTEYMANVNRAGKQEHPILIDKYVEGKELEIDAICDGTDILIPGIMEHIERAGVHSGDSIAVHPALGVDRRVGNMLTEITKTLALALNTKGLINIQFILKGGEIYIIEVNPRSSRTVPFMSKVTGIPMVALALRCALGKPLAQLGYGTGLYKKSQYFAVKVPTFSNEKLPNMEITLSPEMKSTGEVLGLSKDPSEALLKGIIAANMKMQEAGGILFTVADHTKEESVPTARQLSKLGYTIYATGGTATFLKSNGIETITVGKINEGKDDIPNLIKDGKLFLIINTSTRGKISDRDGFKIRRMAIENGIACMTSIDTANALVSVLKGKKDKDLTPVCINDFFR